MGLPFGEPLESCTTYRTGEYGKMKENIAMHPRTPYLGLRVQENNTQASRLQMSGRKYSLD